MRVQTHAKISVAFAPVSKNWSRECIARVWFLLKQHIYSAVIYKWRALQVICTSIGKLMLPVPTLLKLVSSDPGSQFSYWDVLIKKLGNFMVNHVRWRRKTTDTVSGVWKWESTYTFSRECYGTRKSNVWLCFRGFRQNMGVCFIFWIIFPWARLVSIMEMLVYTILVWKYLFLSDFWHENWNILVHAGANARKN